jgi:hypothetical protein
VSVIGEGVVIRKTHKPCRRNRQDLWHGEACGRRVGGQDKRYAIWGRSGCTLGVWQTSPDEYGTLVAAGLWWCRWWHCWRWC